MQYIEYPLTDQGWVDADSGAPLASIDGLDNRTPGQRFRHAGRSGYPPGALACIDAPDQTKTLAILPVGAAVPQGGAEIAEADVPALLVAEYGWPVGTSLGADGLPVAPTREP